MSMLMSEGFLRRGARQVIFLRKNTTIVYCVNIYNVMILAFKKIIIFINQMAMYCDRNNMITLIITATISTNNLWWTISTLYLQNSIIYKAHSICCIYFLSWVVGDKIRAKKTVKIGLTPNKLFLDLMNQNQMIMTN